MYSLTFRVRVTTPPQYGRNRTAHPAGASILSLARGAFAGMRSACGVRWAWWITARLCHALLHRESKKGATLTMAITLSVLGGFAKVFHCCKEQ